MVQSLLYPTNPAKHFRENFMFESISLVTYNVIAPKPYVAPTSNSTDPLGLKRGAVEYLASCLSKSKQCETQLRIDGGRADNEISTKTHKNLEDLMDTVIHLMIAYNMNLRINRICYGILAAFCAAGVCGLMVCSDDWRTSSVKGALSLIDISEKPLEGKNLVEPVWLRTNKYICNLLNKSVFSSESFTPTVPLRFEFSQCLELEFGDAWVAKRVLGSSDEVTLTVPRSAKLTTRIDPL
ncbi:hypothetical protein O181_085344 [Austropuccinia psidii MF-1]|uniref:Uncharacterized protein n=1 Tax=Austropuccinia psidii MF-1 TaxID=1389203 RepID=A0A9Q3FV40_9BASI|nr:hypothetical protein [Austropuccinia psidii MF-1]